MANLTLSLQDELLKREERPGVFTFLYFISHFIFLYFIIPLDLTGRMCVQVYYVKRIKIVRG